MRVPSQLTRGLATGVAALAVAAVAAAPASAAKDRNHDNIPDRWEVKHGLSLSKNQAHKDQDGDNLRNRGEFEASTDPLDPDTDGDGVPDGEEGSGTIASFDATTGELVINAFSAGTITATVTDATEIDCENDDAVQPDDHGDDPTGDDQGDDGPGDGGPGDDTGGDGPGHGRDSHSGEGDSCSTADLITGAVVREASLDLTPTGLVFNEIELN